MDQNKLRFFFQGIKFLIVGGLNTAIDLGVLNVLIFLSGITAGPMFSVFKGISFTVAVINSYLVNKHWTFKAQTQTNAKEVGEFLVVSIIGFFLNVGTASIMVNVIGPQFGLTEQLWANVGALCGTLVTMTWNFLGYKFVVFKR